MHILPAFLLPLAGCFAGALAVYPFGAMLIVFGMFGLGTVAVVVNEIIEWRRVRSANNGIRQKRFTRN